MIELFLESWELSKHFYCFLIFFKITIKKKINKKQIPNMWPECYCSIKYKHPIVLRYANADQQTPLKRSLSEGGWVRGVFPICIFIANSPRILQTVNKTLLCFFFRYLTFTGSDVFLRSEKKLWEEASWILRVDRVSVFSLVSYY